MSKEQEVLTSKEQRQRGQEVIEQLQLDPKRKFTGSMDKFIGALCILISLWHLWVAGPGHYFALTQRALHLMMIGVMIFLTYPMTKNAFKGKIPFYDWILALMLIGVNMYVVMNVDVITERAGAPIATDYIFGFITILLVIEMARRTVGKALPILGAIFLIYAYLGPQMPGMLRHAGYSFERIFSYLFLTTEGIFSVPLQVSVNFIFLFVLFGAFLEKSGAGQFFIDLAMALTGRSKGGPAKASIVASGFLGSISGSSVANTVTTGTFTIPLMKSIGYQPKFAAGVESAASTGGQILPPVMGAAAFIMAEFLGTAYINIALAAIIPALLYFFSLFCMVHFRAGREGIYGIESSKLPKFFKVIKEGFYHFIPLVLLVQQLVVGRSPGRAVFNSIIALIIVMILERLWHNFYHEKEDIATGLINTGKRVLFDTGEAMRNGCMKALEVAAACASAGIIVGITTLTGLGLRFTELIEIASGGILLLALILTMFASLILGMGLPTTAKYIILATLVAPALGRLGVEPLAAHFFILYFGIYADITPPVSLAAYAGAGVAGAKALPSGVEAFKLGLAGYLIPYMFVYGPALILIGSPAWIIFSTLTAVIGVTCLASGVQGFLLTNTSKLERVLFILGALVLINPDPITDAVGFVILFIAAFTHWMKYKKVTKTKQQETVTI